MRASRIPVRPRNPIPKERPGLRRRLPRPIATIVLALTLALGLLPAFAPVRAAAASSGQVRLGGVNYIDARAFGAKFGLEAHATQAGTKVTLGSRWTRIELEADSRECSFNGLRVFLGDATRVYRGNIMLSRLDADKLITPLLLPGSGEKRIPGLKTIVIDPGHGGKDPGKENQRLHINEKTMTLDTARRLKSVLETMGYRVILTRSDDRQIGPDKVSDLQRRAEIANQAHADLFISLHFNAVEASANRVTGVEVYTLTPQSQYSTSDPEKDDDRGAAVANPGNAMDHWNVVLGYQVYRTMISELHADDRGLKRARFAVLRYTTCPAILIEGGFLSNDREASKIATPTYRQQIADAIADGVQAYDNILTGARKQWSGK